MYEKFTINGELKLFSVVEKTLKDEALPTIEHQFILIPAHGLQASIIPEAQNSRPCHNNCEDDQQHHMQNHSIEQQEILLDEYIADDAIDHNEQKKHDLEEPLLSQQSHDDLNNHVHIETTAPSLESLKKILKIQVLPPFWMYAHNANRFNNRAQDTYPGERRFISYRYLF